MHAARWRWTCGIAAVGALALAYVTPAQADDATASPSSYRQINLVSDVPGQAQVTDPNLVNPWGLSFSPFSPLWVSDNGTDVSTLYSGGIHGGPQTIESLVVKIPGGAPTGQVYNSTGKFVVHGAGGSSGASMFLFVGETGHLTGWSPSLHPVTQARNAVITRGAVYKGLAIGMAKRGPLLFAANFSAATVDVYDGSFNRVITTGNFEDPELPARFAPFNVAVLGGKVYVAYAKQDRERVDEVAGSGIGRVDVYTLSGRLMARMSGHKALDAPWGMTIAPTGFGSFSGDLLVGNFGNGRIHAYDPNDLSFVGAVRDSAGNPITIDGLWGLLPGNGVEAAKDEVIFSAGPDDEAHGLLGTLSANGSGPRG
jgi:uncharacterized protein (TIGR03118 family)